MRLRALLFGMIFLLAPGVMLASAWQRFGLGAGEDDILYYLPTRTLFHNGLRDGELPTFNRWNGLGRPLLSDPQTATYYPATWLFAIPALPVLYAYAAHLWLHYSLAMWGCYRLLRAQSHRPAAALFGALVFAFCGFMIAHRNHFTMVAAAAWTPIIFWLVQRFCFGSASLAPMRTRAGYMRFVLATGAISLQMFAGHPQIAALTLLGCVVWIGAQSRQARKRTSQADAASPAAPREPPLLPVALRLALPWCASIALFAIQWIPTARYAALCDRADWSYREFTENSYEPLSLVSWVFPMLLGNATPNFFDQPYWGPSHQSEQLGYVGIAPLVLAVLALRTPWRYSRTRLGWTLLLLVAFLLALGRFGPLCPLLYWLPGSQMFRCPARALLLVDLCLAALACSVVDDLLSGLTPRRARLRAALRDATANPLKTALYLLSPPIILLLLALPWLDAAAFREALRALSPTNPALIVPIAASLGSLLALSIFARSWRDPRWVYLVMAVTALDLGLLSNSVYAPRGNVNFNRMTKPDADDEWLPYIRDDRRIWIATLRAEGEKPAEYVNPLAMCIANTNLLEPHGEPPALLTDYGPLQPRAYVQAFAMRPWGESTQARALLEDTSWTTAANVGWILVTHPDLPAPANAAHVTTTRHGYRLFDVGSGSALARFVDATTPGALRAEWRSNNQLSVHVAAGAGGAAFYGDVEIELSLLNLPGWRYTVNGVTRPAEAGPGLMYLQARVPANQEAPVVFSYETPGLKIGAAVSMVAFVLMMLLIVLFKKA